MARTARMAPILSGRKQRKGVKLLGRERRRRRHFLVPEARHGTQLITTCLRPIARSVIGCRPKRKRRANVSKIERARRSQQLQESIKLLPV